MSLWKDPEEPTEAPARWRRMVVAFTPSYFAITLGTGIVSLLLATFPYRPQWLYYVAASIVLLHGLYVFVFLSLSGLKWIFYPKVARAEVEDPRQLTVTSVVPINLATTLNMFYFAPRPHTELWASYLALAIWIAVALLSIGAAFSQQWTLMTRKADMSLASINALWLLPLVSCLVASATGGMLAGILPNRDLAFWVIMCSYALWGIGFPMALVTLVIYLRQLSRRGLPTKATAPSVFLPLVPIAQGAFGIQQLGKASQEVFSKSSHLGELAGNIFNDIGLFFAILMWGLGLFWLIFAVATIVKTNRVPFNLGWWAFPFSLGVYALCTCHIGQAIDSRFFTILGTILSVTTMASWILLSFVTWGAVLRGRTDLDFPLEPTETRRGSQSVSGA